MPVSEKLSSLMMKRKRCFVGFDAFIDYITRPIAGREGGKPRYFSSLDAYSDFLGAQKNKSFSVELEIPEVKPGGNNPNISDIMSRFGVDVVSFGAYGMPLPDPVFRPLAERCRLVSFASPGVCTSYEFSVNKMMNFYNMASRDFTYENLLKFISEEEMAGILQRMDMIIFVNLGEQPAVLNIMEAFLERIFPTFREPKIFFTDFSDCSHMSGEELSRGLHLLKNMKAFGEVTLSANEHEFHILAAHSGGAAAGAGNYQSALKKFREAAAIDQVILRTLPAFYCSSPRRELRVENQYVEYPQYLTGAGDAQNGGICLGLLAGLPMEEALAAGVWAGNCYIHTGTVEPELLSEGVMI
jgi:hypothetical protein